MADRRPEPLVSGKALSSLRVVDLKQELEKRGCPKSGTKKDLMDRLRTRLELEAMQSAPSGAPEPPPSEEEPNDFVKAYLAEQQQSFQKQIEIRQQVISETEAPAAGTESATAVGAGAPPAEPAVQAEDLSSPARSVPAPASDTPPSRRSLRSTSTSESPAAPPVSAEETDKMPTAEPATSASAAEPTNLKIQEPLPEVESPSKHHEKPAETQAVAEEQPARIVAEVDPAPVVEAQSDSPKPDAAPVQTDPVVVAPSGPEAIAAPQQASADTTDAPTAATHPEVPSKLEPVVPPAAPEVGHSDTAVEKPAPEQRVEDQEVKKETATEQDDQPATKEPTVKDRSAADHRHQDVSVASSSPSKEERRSRESRRHSDREDTGEKKETPRDRGSDRRRLAVEKKEEAGDEAKTKPKRKWGSGSERQISRGISSSQLNNLLPKTEKVSVSGQEESQAGDAGSENTTLSGNFSRPANGSLESSQRSSSDLPEAQDPEAEQKPVNGQSSVSEAVAGSGELAPAQHPVSNVLFIENLTRPFTLPALHSLLQTYGKIDTDKFWIDRIKSMCLVAYASADEAEVARKALYGTKWPLSNPKSLVVDFSTEEEIEVRKAEAEKPVVPPAPRASNDKYDITIRKTFPEEKDAAAKPVRDWDRDKLSPPPSKRSRRSPSPGTRPDEKQSSDPEPEGPAKLLDDLFKKTSSAPIIYWLPLSDEDAVKRMKEREEIREKRRQEREVARPARRSPPPPPRAVRSPRGRGSYRGGERPRGRDSRSVSRSRSRSPVRTGGRYRSPMRRSPPRRR